MTFGELMLRISPGGDGRLATVTCADIAFGGAECNVAVAAARMGAIARYVTALPENPIADAATMKVRSFGVDTSHMVRIAGRIGIYFVEPAAGLLPASVIYDRADSAVTKWQPSDSEIDGMLKHVTHFHFTGITVAIGGQAPKILRRIVERCKALGIHVSLDVNYRMKLWSVDEASNGLAPFLPYVDTLICNENHARMLFGCTPESDLDKAALLFEQFRGLKTVIVSRRRAIDEFHDQWSAVAANAAGLIGESITRKIRMIERVGGGDAFAGAFLAELMAGRDIRHCLDFAAATLALKHSIPGDFCTFTRQDVETILFANSTSGVVR